MAFWCGAAGVRLDVLGPDLAVGVFEHLLREAFVDAASLGYTYVHAAAPWEQHPYLPKPFVDYAGLEVVPIAEGDRSFLLKWRLADAVDGLRTLDGVRTAL
jgi:hypothetical protein